jgi:hypothetical protein
MSTGLFREDELVTRKIKVNGEWQARTFPVVGGRLRIAHEQNDKLSIKTEIVRLEESFAAVKATATTSKGDFCGFGTASAQRDARLADSLLELAETRSIARALRFASYGCEFTSAEEMSHVLNSESEKEPSANKERGPAFPEDNGKPETKPQTCGIGRATQAQCRALYALTKRAKYTEQDIESLLRPLNAATFQDLSRESASQLITYLQTEAAA